MNVETNNIHLEKSLSFFYKILYLNFLQKKNSIISENYTKCIKKLSIKKLAFVANMYIAYREIFDLKFTNKNCRFFHWYKNTLNKKTNNTEIVKSCFIISDTIPHFSRKRRKRRKFLTEDERRVARILKNRRTAEESRQRRIQKMKQLENFVTLSEEKEKKTKKEIYYLGKVSATHMVTFFTKEFQRS